MGDDGTGWDADVPISRCVSEVTCYNPAPHPAVSNLRAAKVGGAGDFDNSSNFGPPVSPWAIPDPDPSKFWLDRPLFSFAFASTYSYSIGGVSYRSGGLGFLPLLHLRLVKKQTRSTPLRTSFLLIVTVKPIFAFRLF